MSGKLFIVATPIGNLSDLSPRTKEALSECHIVLAEDTRVSLKLLNHLGLKKKLLSCHDYNEAKRVSLLEEVNQLNQSVALVSDAGTPLLCDPGFQIVKQAQRLGMQIIPIAGPSAFLLALVGSGLPCHRFAFEGFLPDKKGQRIKHLQELKDDDRTLIFYVSPHDLADVLSQMLECFGNRKACLARELTKLHEEFVYGTLSKLLEKATEVNYRGECVLVVAGRTERKQLDKTAVKEELVQLLSAGMRLKQASAELSQSTGWSKGDIYRLGIEWADGKDGN